MILVVVISGMVLILGGLVFWINLYRKGQEEQRLNKYFRWIDEKESIGGSSCYYPQK